MGIWNSEKNCMLYINIYIVENLVARGQFMLLVFINRFTLMGKPFGKSTYGNANPISTCGSAKLQLQQKNDMRHQTFLMHINTQGIQTLDLGRITQSWERDGVGRLQSQALRIQSPHTSLSHPRMVWNRVPLFDRSSTWPIQYRTNISKEPRVYVLIIFTSNMLKYKFKFRRVF